MSLHEEIDQKMEKEGVVSEEGADSIEVEDPSQEVGSEDPMAVLEMKDSNKGRDRGEELKEESKEEDKEEDKEGPIEEDREKIESITDSSRQTIDQ